MTTPLTNLELADLSIQSAIGHLVTAAEASDDNAREVAKAIASLGASAGEVCS